jgi:hypothetical protein
MLPGEQVSKTGGNGQRKKQDTRSSTVLCEHDRLGECLGRLFSTEKVSGELLWSSCT